MRRAALLALLVLPTVGVAQVTYTAQTPPTYNVPTPTTPNTVGFLTLPLSTVDGFINLDECLNPRAISFKWLIQTYEQGFSSANLPGGRFTVYVNDQATTSGVNTGPCPTVNGDKNVPALNAGPIGAAITENLTDPSLGYDFDTAQIATVAGQGACNTPGTDIIVCVQAKDAAGDNIGEARVRLTVETSKPGPPLNPTATPGDQALNVSWADPGSSPSALSYLIDATPVGTIIDPTGHHLSPRITTTNYRLGGLVNGQMYNVAVVSFSEASNESAPSFVTSVTPLPVADFWTLYKDEGGRDSGGCTSGSAGVLALAALGGLLAMARRRR
jgi:MYXO-CTERM domain-containing protein